MAEQSARKFPDKKYKPQNLLCNSGQHFTKNSVGLTMVLNVMSQGETMQMRKFGAAKW